jgi:hypothetical protein
MAFAYVGEMSSYYLLPVLYYFVGAVYIDLNFLMQALQSVNLTVEYLVDQPFKIPQILLFLA